MITHCGLPLPVEGMHALFTPSWLDQACPRVMGMSYQAFDRGLKTIWSFHWSRKRTLAAPHCIGMSLHCRLYAVCSHQLRMRRSSSLTAMFVEL